MKIKHHDITLKIEPKQGTLKASDRVKISGHERFRFYLGNRFDVLSIKQGDRCLDWEVDEKRKLMTRYSVDNWDSEGSLLEINWEGAVSSFQGYKVCIIREDLVELSGFCWWFPTIEPQSQFESFTYDLELDLPEDWTAITPGESIGKKSRYRYTRKIEDIFICASPLLDTFERECCGLDIEMHIPKEIIKFKEVLIDDFSSSIELCTKLFGSLKKGNGGIGIVSPRGKEGAEWGFERDGLWVVGDLFAEYLIDNDWKIDDLPKSLSLHETIHGWFGVGVDFKEPWLAEAITQYLEVILTAMINDKTDVEEKYFNSYRERLEKHLAQDDRPVNELTFLDDMYTHWYLKGSWAFWDMEASVGRDRLLELFRIIYRDFVGDKLSYEKFKRISEEKLDLSPDFMEHWFEEEGFEPIYREIH